MPPRYSGALIHTWHTGSRLHRRVHLVVGYWGQLIGVGRRLALLTVFRSVLFVILLAGLFFACERGSCRSCVGLTVSQLVCHRNPLRSFFVAFGRHFQ